MSKLKLPDLQSDEEANAFVSEADLSRYDLSGAKRHRFNFGGTGHKFEIVRDKRGEFRVRFKFRSEIIFATEGYASRSSALKAIEAIKKHVPTASGIDAPDDDAFKGVS